MSAADIRRAATSIMQLDERSGLYMKLSPASGGPFPLTELGNAERHVHQHGPNIHFSHQFACWFYFDGRRWCRDIIGETIRLAKLTVRGIYSEASDTDDGKRRAAVSDWARKSERAAQITAMLKLAESEPGVPVTPEQLDRDEWLLNVANGSVDLRTGQLKAHDRRDLITKIVPVAFDPKAQCTKWLQFLDQIFEPHPDVIRFIQTAVGYSLAGSTREECLFLLYGTGRNGKGTFIKTIASILGEYAFTADFSTFVSTRDDRGPRDDVANMHGRRFVSAQESREGAALAESLIKWLTGGDTVRARRLYENSWEYQPTHKIWLATNHKPAVRGNDPAIWSRIRLVPFEVSFEGREDKTLKHVLQEELPGILAWAVAGCLRWQQEGLTVPDTVRSATSEYRAESDAVGRFIGECCIVGEYATAKARELYAAYRRWSEGSGEEPVTETSFGRRITERGFAKRHTSQGKQYQGVGLQIERGE